MSSESTNAGTAAPERATTVAAAVTAEVPVSASAVDPTPAPGSATVGSDEAKGEEPAVCVANLNVSINKHAILHDVSFKLAPGARCLVLGPNGAGSCPVHFVQHVQPRFHCGKVFLLSHVV